ncbi:L-lactate dehydrogenase [Arcanobacterium phocae]|uniref:L-lactate dehydrogenase n=1 Tax=Arcanobacterium phocae TaxID=131112 RepID=UPI001C0EF5C7|nr:L-lactate dehydrogenase [Arcanobacterium phocae]
MTTQFKTKMSVIGAGSVGTALAYAAMLRGSANVVALFDINKTKVDAEVLDLAHGTQFMAGSELIGGSDITVTANSDIVLITAGAKQNPGQTRLELAEKNARILESLMSDLVPLSPNAIFVLVTNPVDVLTAAAVKFSGLPAGRVFGSGTVLDSSRLRWLVGRKIGVSPRSVHSLIVGEHGDSEFALWSSATIGQVSLRDWCNDKGEKVFSDEVLHELEQEVINSAYKIIEGKGATNYAIGVAGARIVEAVLNNQRAILPVSSVLNGSFGVEDVALAVPCIVGANGVERPIEFPMDSVERARFDASVEALAAAQKTIGL